MAQLRDAQLQRAEPGVEAAIAILIEPVADAVVPTGTRQPLDVDLQDLQHRLRHDSQKISIPLFCSSSTSAILSSVLGSSVVAGGLRKSTATHPP